MKELARETGLAPSTIHYYLREGLVPPAEKPTRNSARYDEAHVARLKLIRDLRAGEPRMPLASIERVLELVDQGVEPEVAEALQRSVARGLGNAGSRRDEAYGAKELSGLTGLPRKTLDELLKAGVILPSPAADPPFDAADRVVAEHAAELFRSAPVTVSELAEIAELLRAASAKEIELRNRAVLGLDAASAARVSGRMQEWANLWHAYLFSRARQHEIAVHGLGVPSPTAKPARPDDVDEEAE